MRTGPFDAVQAAALALALVSASWPTLAWAAPPTDADPPALTDDELRQAARAEVGAASQAFQAGDYATALAHYEAAMALRPAPKLHYNIAVCHQRLSLAAEDPEQRTRERDLAIASYNAYLEQVPDAEDRLEVAQSVRELGGTPATMPGLKPLFTPEATTGEDPADTETSTDVAETETETETETDSETEPEPERPDPRHGRFGAALLGGISPDLRAAEDVDAPSLLAFELHGGGYVGRRRHMLLAAYTSLFAGAPLRADGLAFYGYALGLLMQHQWVVGQPHDALAIGLGGIVALTGQGISERPTVAATVCSLEDRGGQVAGRTGALLAPRFDFNVLMGPRRRAMIGLIVQPSVAVFGDGPSAPACQAGQTPWTVLGIRRRWQFQFWAGAGFNFRF